MRSYALLPLLVDVSSSKPAFRLTNGPVHLMFACSFLILSAASFCLLERLMTSRESWVKPGRKWGRLQLT